jgi:hypothetical protein
LDTTARVASKEALEYLSAFNDYKTLVLVISRSTVKNRGKRGTEPHRGTKALRWRECYGEMSVESLSEVESDSSSVGRRHRFMESESSAAKVKESFYAQLHSAASLSLIE